MLRDGCDSGQTRGEPSPQAPWPDPLRGRRGTAVELVWSAGRIRGRGGGCGQAATSRVDVPLVCSLPVCHGWDDEAGGMAVVEAVELGFGTPSGKGHFGA